MNTQLSPAEYALLATFTRARNISEIPKLPEFAPADSWTAYLQEPIERANEKLVNLELIESAGIEAHVDKYRTKAELKDLLAEQKLRVSGDKPELINRAITAGIQYLLEPEQINTLYVVSLKGEAWLKEFWKDKSTDYLSKRIFKFMIEAIAAGVVGNKADDFINYIYNLVTGQKGVEIVNTKAPAKAAADEANTVRGLSSQLKSFEFLTVRLNEYGRVVDRRKDHARYYIEPLSRGVSLEMVQIPGGSCLMGTSDQDITRVRQEYKRYGWPEQWVMNESPQHKVMLSPFYFSKFQITQMQWRIVAGWPKVKRNIDPEPSHFKNRKNPGSLPVENISWHDAEEFCARLSAKTGRVYRLPTEAEWEYACRAGTTTPFAFGETITPEIVNYDGNRPYGKAKKGEYREKTIPVGSLGVANAFGLYDMHGNVWEWCQDWYSKDYYAECHKQGVVTDPQGPETGETRVLRGGSWLNNSNYCRSADRDNNVPGNRDIIIGLRVVVSARTLS
ncbi:MAG: SUMF1/EgtB/PvdO family nonheme iron enzyme [Acidobacteriota bacterium]|nr:MAG: SUMF1/EgtB/PvdO family nonheme iron enzyme [Acidobacteriota bacterium]